MYILNKRRSFREGNATYLLTATVWRKTIAWFLVDHPHLSGHDEVLCFFGFRSRLRGDVIFS